MEPRDLNQAFSGERRPLRRRFFATTDEGRGGRCCAEGKCASPRRCETRRAAQTAPEPLAPRVRLKAHRRSQQAAIAVGAALLAHLAFAHVGEEAPARWTAGWTFTPLILAGLAALAALYASGLARQGASGESRARHLSFFAALLLWFLALQSPLDAYAEHSFFVHQIQHLLLQTVAPLLFMLAAPQRLLAAGVPAPLRRWLLAPLLGSRALRALFGLLLRPWVATLLFVASTAVWHWPAYHDRAILDPEVHDWMHLSMLAGGLLFFGSVLDPRPAPLGARYGVRFNALWLAMTAYMLLGAGLALKTTVLYPAYAEVGRLAGLSAISDERIGGLIMWIPGSAACVPAFLVLLRRWGRQEARLYARRRRGIPVGAAGAVASNSRVALWLAAAALFVFAVTLGVALAWYRY